MTQIYISKAIEDVLDLHGALYGQGFNRRPIREQLDLQAQDILIGHGRRHAGAWVHLTCWLPATVGWQPEAIFVRSLTMDEARLSIARECGFMTWAEVAALGDLGHDQDFEAAIDAVVSGDLAALTNCLQARPDLAGMTSRFGHRATLLHYIAANGVETYRQVTPLNAAEVASLLIVHGSDVNAEANMYGGGMRPLGLMMTSDHPFRAGVQGDLARVLTAAGAR